jgi:hypothetical protein
MPLSSGKRAVVEFHDDAVQGLQGRLDLDQLEDDRLVGPNIAPEAMRKRRE